MTILKTSVTILEMKIIFTIQKHFLNGFFTRIVNLLVVLIYYILIFLILLDDTKGIVVLNEK